MNKRTNKMLKTEHGRFGIPASDIQVPRSERAVRRGSARFVRFVREIKDFVSVDVPTNILVHVVHGPIDKFSLLESIVPGSTIGVDS